MASDLRRRYADLLMTKVEETNYPSAELMNRVESTLADREQAEQYARILFQKVDESQYPSLQLLDRVERLARLLD
jgi:hypothetical protein